MRKTLEGVKVIDLTSLRHAGSAYTRQLADCGAEVILLEPLRADESRLSNENQFYHGGKKSISADLRTAEGKELALKLLKTADVFVTDWFAGDLQACGISYEAVRAVNPRIIYAHGSVYGEEGPLANREADASAVWWTQTGAAWCTMEIGDVAPVMNPGLSMVNPATSIALGVCAALFRRVRTGEGMYVSTSVLGDAIYSNCDSPLEMQYGAEYPKTRKRPRRTTLNTYHCKDGWIMLITLSFEKDWNNLLTDIGLENLIGDGRWKCIEDTMYENSPEITALFDEAIAKLTCDEVVSRVKAHDMAVMKLKTAEDVLKDEQALANGDLVTVTDAEGREVMIPTTPLRFGDNLPAEPRKAPKLGEQTVEILKACGYTEEQVEILLKKGIVFAAKD